MLTPGDALLAYVDQAQIIVLHLDHDFVVTGANPYAQHRLGGKTLKLKGLPFSQLLVDFIPAGDLRGNLDQPGPARPLTLKTANVMPETFLFNLYAVPDGILAIGKLDTEELEHLRDEVLGLNRELNETTRQLHQANAELKELNALKDKFLGMAAHDLRRPLAVLITYTELLQTDTAQHLNREEQTFLQHCADAAHAMARLVDDFLDVSLISAGRFAIDPCPTSCADLIAGAMVLVRVIADRKSVRLYVENHIGDTRINLDAPKIQQVLVNLMGNAIEHSHPYQQVHISFWIRDNRLEVAVRDQGPGIKPEDQGKLFTTFERAGTRKTGGERSIGLGLAIARLVVEAHGGCIWVDSTPGHGSTFAFSIPMTTTAPGPDRKEGAA